MSRTPRLLLVGTALAAAAVLTLTGCGPSSSATPQTQPSTGQNGQSAGQNGNRISGKIAEVDGKTLQVQTRDAQTAVTYTSKTTFTQQASAKATAVVQGVCVNVRSAATGSSASAAPQATPATAVTATSVSITAAASDGSCGMGGGQGGGTPPGGGPSGAPQGGQPSGAPSGMPSGGPGGQTGGGMSGARPVFGTVASVTGSGFTVTSQGFGGSGSQTITVTTTADTTYTKQVKASADDAKVGTCLSANGTPDSTGAVAATTISLSPAVDGGCTVGRGR